MVTRRLLVEMPVVSESEVFAQEPVASVSTEKTNNLEGVELKAYIFSVIGSIQLPKGYVLKEREIGTIISHHCTGRPLKKAALQAIPQVINANNVLISDTRFFCREGVRLNKEEGERLAAMAAESKKISPSQKTRANLDWMLPRAILFIAATVALASPRPPAMTMQIYVILH